MTTDDREFLRQFGDVFRAYRVAIVELGEAQLKADRAGAALDAMVAKWREGKGARLPTLAADLPTLDVPALLRRQAE